jgi:hypothetical protein
VGRLRQQRVPNRPRQDAQCTGVSALTRPIAAILAAAAAFVAGCERPRSTPTPTAATAHPSAIATASSALASRAEAPPPLSPVRELDGDCPYLSREEAADLEGNRVGRTTVLTTKPPGCRFYFDPNFGAVRPTLEISVARYATPVQARNAMITIASRSTEQAGQPDLAPGVDGIRFRTRFYPKDGNRDWACSFAKGVLLVTVKTDQTDTSTDAYNIARQILGRI